MDRKISLDKFRIIVAILIIAIHTYPFASINENLDFAFTHIFCRIGVPFFLMTTGYFILPKAIEDRKTLVKYTIKIVKIYLICILLYLPVNIYANKLNGIGILELIQEIFINGTFYHLWYFPALILGIWITYFVIKHIKGNKEWYIMIFLFIIGLFGDSYYEISKKSEVITRIYDMIFTIFDYTRNGLFFVPIFLYIGYRMKNIELKLSKKRNIICIIVCVLLMIGEGFILHNFNLQKHDSMYVMLIPTMIFIFNFIIRNKNEEGDRSLRKIAMIIYITHPIFIIVVRGIAKVLKMQRLMIDNSIVHYLLVVILTLMFSIILEKVEKKVVSKNGRK